MLLTDILTLKILIYLYITLTLSVSGRVSIVTAKNETTYTVIVKASESIRDERELLESIFEVMNDVYEMERQKMPEVENKGDKK